jgi:hypothetical protein
MKRAYLVLAVSMLTMILCVSVYRLSSSAEVPVDVAAETFFKLPLIKEGAFFGITSFRNPQITCWEDPCVFNATDGFYYMYFSGDTTFNFRKLWLFRASNLDFSDGVLIGPILNSPAEIYENVRVRAAGMLFDEANQTYVAVYSGIGSNVSGYCLLFCGKADFPNGPWTEAKSNPIIPDMGISCFVYHRSGMWYAVSSGNREVTLYTSINLDSKIWTSVNLTQLRPVWSTGGSRSPLVLKSGVLYLIEGYDNGFYIDLAYINETAKTVQHWSDGTQKYLVSTTPEEGNQTANPNFYYDEPSQTAYIYYQVKNSPLGKSLWDPCMRAKVNLNQTMTEMTAEDWQRFYDHLKNSGSDYWKEFLDKMLAEWQRTRQP